MPGDLPLFLNDLGDTAVLGCLSLATASYLAGLGQWRAGAVQLAALVGAGLGIGLLKVAFLGCGAALGGLGIHTPSGHTALSAAVLGTLASQFEGQFSGWRRLAPHLAAASVVGGVAAAGMIYSLHSVDEVLIGLAVGVAVATLARSRLRRRPPDGLDVPFLGAQTLLVLVALNGTRLPVEMAVYRLSAWVHREAPVCHAAIPPVAVAGPRST